MKYRGVNMGYDIRYVDERSVENCNLNNRVENQQKCMNTTYLFLITGNIVNAPQNNTTSERILVYCRDGPMRQRLRWETKITRVKQCSVIYIYGY